MEIKLSDINLRALTTLDLSTLVEIFGKLTNGKKAVAIAVACFFIILIIMGVLYISGGAERTRLEVESAFEEMSKSRAQGDVRAIASSISTSFNDAGMNFGTALRYFSRENPGYTAVIENIAVQGEEALVSYKRAETINGQRKIIDVLNEKWKKEDAKWVLVGLSEMDKQLLKSFKGKTKSPEQSGKSGIRQSPLPANNIISDEVAVATPPEPVAPVFPVKEEYPPYTSMGKRDPFKSLVAGFDRDGQATVGGPLKTCDAGRAREFLESFDLMSVNLVGIIGGKSKFALIETPNGNGYTVKKGMHIGRNCGKIVQIGSDRMFVNEQYPDRKTGIKHVTRELKLRQDEQ